MDLKCTNDTCFCYNKDLDKNLAGLTRKTEDPKGNKGNLTFPSHTLNVIEMQSNKKVKSGNSSFLNQHPFPGLYPISRKSLCTSTK